MAFSLEFQKFSHSGSEQFWKQNAIFFCKWLILISNNFQVEEDASDEDSDDSDEDEIVDYVSATEPITQHYSSFSETADHQEYFDYLDLDSYSYQNQLESAVSKSIYDETSTPSLPTSFEEFVKNLENAENSNTNQTGEKSTFISYEHFFSALKENSQLNNVIKKFDELKTSDSTEKLSEDKSIHVTCSGDSLISGAESRNQKSSVRFTENYTLAYLDSAIESDFTQLKNSEAESLLNFSNTELENNNNAANSEEFQQIADYSIENQSENHNTNSEVAVLDQQYSNQTSEPEQDFSCKYLDYLDSISEENQLNSAKSIEINQESDSLLIDSELLFKNEFSIDSAYSSEYCFTPEEIEEFTKEFETLTNLT